MGTYCTTTSVQTRMVDTLFDTATTALVSECITDAENEINKWLSKRYDISSSQFLTYSTVPPMVKSMCTWLTIGYAYDDMGRGKGEEVYTRSKRYIKRALDNLKLISDGELNLLDTAGSAIVESSTGSYNVYTNYDDYSSSFVCDDGSDCECCNVSAPCETLWC